MGTRGLGIAFLLWSALAWATGEEAGTPGGAASVCPVPVVSHPSAADLEAMARDLNVVELAVGPDDQALGTGNSVVDSSCLTGGNADSGAAVAAKLRSAVARAVDRVTACQASLGFPGIEQITRVLGNTRFQCDPPSGDRVAHTDTTYRRRDSAGHAYNRVAASAYGRYRIAVTAADASVANPKDRRGMLPEIPTEELASFLFHEAMHVLPMNNRGWHDSLGSDIHDDGCSGSRFSDRIYLTQAACFPDSSLGGHFYRDGGAYACPAVCRSALTEVDDSVRTDSYQHVDALGPTGIYGPSMVSSPLPSAQVESICSRIQSRRGEGLYPPGSARALASPMRPR